MTTAAVKHAGPADPVLQWAGYANVAHKRYPDVPVAVLLGLTRVESGGHSGETSRTGAQGLTQFEPATARQYGVDVRPGHELSQLVGAAHYLHDLGYAKNPAHALNAYNGAQTIDGHPNPYAGDVLAAARGYGHVPDTPSSPGSGGQSTNDGGGGPLLDDQKKSQVLSGVLTVALVLGGALLLYTGVNVTSGGRVHAAVKGARRAGEAAALA